MRPLLRVDAVLVQAVIAGALSFSHLHDLAEAAGQHGWKAWAYPVSVDLLLVAAWRRLRSLRGTGASRNAAWSWFAVALAASLGANIATAGLLDLGHVPAWLRILVAGWPALAFLGGALLVHAPPEPREPEPVPAAVAEDPGPQLVREEMPEPRTSPPPELLPSAPLAPPSDAPAVPDASPSVPPALVAHARKLADSHRSATGRDIDADTLRSRLGVPAPMADAIAAQLA
ncbi:DUF2637 domain-containing protein [Streptomyces lichenis]|uniref:DUF2637 domain-containing protein n=1 Tax=Streptomyces lichenis TaxID=2306967 RepID=A0ABT0I4Y6_9ACTN|nr:DUF2637 domain-containing protein [Streptomyces lichenis]MCK8676403.1 DUF2637 domain-containing protein [Streptomyces lichenis]